MRNHFRNRANAFLVFLIFMLFSNGVYGGQKQARVIKVIPINPNQKHIYLAGQQAVLNGPTLPEFRMGVYFSEAVEPHEIRYFIEGLWPRGAFSQQELEDLHDFLSIDVGSCDWQVNQEQQLFFCEVLLGFRYLPDAGSFRFGVDVVRPAGRYRVMPQSSFLFLIPQNEAEGDDRILETKFEQQATAAWPVNDLSLQKQVVQVLAPQSHSAGSGFIVESVNDIAWLSGAQVAKASEPFYVLTAAHLFPELFGLAMYHADLNQERYDISIQGRRYKGVLRLAYFNPTADIAVLVAADAFAMQRLLQVLPKRDGKVHGLELVEQLSFDSCAAGLCRGYTVYGYPQASAGRLVRKEVRFASLEYPTSETSNFGSLRKMKFVPASGKNDILLAQPGMSGGAILNNAGQVVAMASERVIGQGSLVAIELSRSYQLKVRPIKLGCQLVYDPFNLLLLFEVRTPDCEHGDFGSGLLFDRQLDGLWLLQEILGVGSRGAQGGLINGHGIIAGYGEERSVLIPEQMGESTDYKVAPYLRGKYGVEGVRLIVWPESYEYNCKLQGKQVVAVRNSIDQPWQRLRSTRDFIIWLRLQPPGREVSQLLQVKEGLESCLL